MTAANTRPMTEAQEQAFDALRREVEEVQPLPAIAARLLAMAEDSHFSAQDLAATIKTDQAITLKILRLANSPAIGMPQHITSLRQAIVLLGFREVRGMALTACVLDASSRERIGSAGLNYETFWVNSLAIAFFSQALAELEGIDRDEAFTAGVVHNVGRLVLAQHRPDWLRLAVTTAVQRKLSIHEVQAALFGFTDAELGATVARSWTFPDSLVAAVERHALPISEFEEKAALDSIVARARRFARSHDLSDSLDPPGPRLSADYDWQIPQVADALKRMGGPAKIVQNARSFLREVSP